MYHTAIRCPSKIGIAVLDPLYTLIPLIFNNLVVPYHCPIAGGCFFLS